MNDLTRNPSTFDAGRAELFAGRMLDMLNHGALTLMISIGHRSGLLDTLAVLPPATSAGIAEAAGLNERYVREWLGAMVTGGIVDHDPESQTFSLAPEHAACLTRTAAPDNLAAYAQYVPLLGQVEDEILHCFRHGGGVPYERYPRFHEVMAEDSAQTVVAALEEHILALVPGLVERLAAGIDVLDVGCGSGRALISLARRFPASRFTGYDFSPEAIGRAVAEAESQGLTNVVLEVQDAATLDEPGAYDLITTFDAIHDQADPSRVLGNIRRALRPDGVYLMQDISGTGHVHGDRDHPLGPLLYTVSCMHCMSVSLAQGGAGLGAMWGREQATGLLRDAGFERIEIHRLEHDPQNDYYVIRRNA